MFAWTWIECWINVVRMLLKTTWTSAECWWNLYSILAHFWYEPYHKHLFDVVISFPWTLHSLRCRKMRRGVRQFFWSNLKKPPNPYTRKPSGPIGNTLREFLSHWKRDTEVNKTPLPPLYSGTPANFHELLGGQTCIYWHYANSYTYSSNSVIYFVCPVAVRCSNTVAGGISYYAERAWLC